MALSELGLELAAVGNHEFDKGPAELLRMQEGGCEQHTERKPCAVEPFAGAKFQYLAANVVTADGPDAVSRHRRSSRFGGVRIGFIGMTLKETATLVSPDGVKGLSFADEAATANAAVPALRAAGAQAIVLLIHQGGTITNPYYDRGCGGISGDILPILAKLDPSISLVVSGHTHNAYICRVPMTGGGERLLTSAGKYGAMVTDIRLTFARRDIDRRQGRFRGGAGRGDRYAAPEGAAVERLPGLSGRSGGGGDRQTIPRCRRPARQPRDRQARRVGDQGRDVRGIDRGRTDQRRRNISSPAPPTRAHPTSH